MFGAGGVLVTVLILLASLAGCIGDPGVQPGTKGPAEDPSANGSLTTDGTSPSTDPATRRLSLVVELDPTSQGSIRILGLDVAPRPMLGDGFVPNPGRVQPGESRHVLMFTVEEGRSLAPRTVELTVDDGRGEATLALELGRWSGEADARQVLTLHRAEAGALATVDLDGPLDGRVLTPEAERSYGLLLWPDDRARVLESFPYRVHAPEAYPNDLMDGQRVRFLVEDADAPVRWELDGRSIAQGPTYEGNATPGAHHLTVHVGEDGPSLELPYTVDDVERFNGTILAAAEPAAGQDLVVNRASHPFHVDPGAVFLSVVTEVTEDAPGRDRSDLNVTVLDEDGEIVATSQETSAYEDRIVLPQGLPAGDYTLQVEGQKGATIDYEGRLLVVY